MKICSVPAGNKIWKDKKKNKKTTGTVWNGILNFGWMAADGYSRECGILEDKPAVSTREPRILTVLSAVGRKEKCTGWKKTCYSLCLSCETLPLLLATIPPLGRGSRAVLFTSYGMGIGKILLCTIRDRRVGVIDHDDLKIHREKAGWI